MDDDGAHPGLHHYYHGQNNHAHVTSPTGAGYGELTRPQPCHRPVRVQEQFRNPDDLNSLPPVNAYAKLSGYDWTYYIRDVVVSIGRSSDQASAEEEAIDVDLGPAKTVSRKHADIKYNFESTNWEIEIKGRNGIKLDGVSYKPEGENISLSSGQLLEIGGVQFLFLLPTMESTEQEDQAQDDDDDEAVGNDRDNDEEDDEEYHYDDDDGYGTTRHRRAAVRSAKRSRSQLVTGTPRASKRARTMASGDTSAVMSPEDHAIRGVSGLSPPPLEALAPAAIPADFMRRRSVDYSTDEMREIKPPYSYATLIAEAINNSPIKAMSLSEIYQFISDNYAFFRHATHSWQNSVRHNLSLNRAFQKVARPSNLAGKGCLWRIDPEHAHELTDEPKRPKRKAAELYNLDEHGNSEAVQAIHNVMQAQQQHAELHAYGHPIYGMSPYSSMYPSLSLGGYSHGLAQTATPQPAAPLEALFSLSTASMASSAGMATAPDIMGKASWGSDQGSVGAAPIGVNSSFGASGTTGAIVAGSKSSNSSNPIASATGATKQLYRSYYSLYHTTPDLTLLPTPAGLMRSMPKLFKNAHLLDQAPPTDGSEPLVGDFLDRAAFPKIGNELNLTKEQLKAIAAAAQPAGQSSASGLGTAAVLNVEGASGDGDLGEGVTLATQLPKQTNRHGHPVDTAQSAPPVARSPARAPPKASAEPPATRSASRQAAASSSAQALSSTAAAPARTSAPGAGSQSPKAASVTHSASTSSAATPTSSAPPSTSLPLSCLASSSTTPMPPLAPANPYLYPGMGAPSPYVYGAYPSPYRPMSMYPGASPYMYGGMGAGGFGAFGFAGHYARMYAQHQLMSSHTAASAASGSPAASHEIAAPTAAGVRPRSSAVASTRQA